LKKVVLRAPLLSISGYGVHSRQVFRWLLTQPVEILCQIVPWGDTSWMLNDKLEGGLVGEIMKRSASQELGFKPDLSIQVILPNEWVPNLAHKNIGVSAWVETDVCNPEWIQAANLMDALVVPSEFTKKVIQNTGEVRPPLYVVPESYFSEIDNDSVDKIDLGLSTDFNFLIVGQITGNRPETDRKNTYNAIKWICEEFKDDSDVGIVIKTNSARGTTIDKSLTRRHLNGIIHKVRKGPHPKIYMVHGGMSSSEMSSLYKHPKIKALVSVTRGEGWGLPLLEASAAGLPVIATGWSGHCDFLNIGKYIKIDYDLEAIPTTKIDNKIFMKGARWAQPREDDAKKKLRKFRQRDAIPAQWAKDNRGKIREAFSEISVLEKYSQALGEFLK